MKSKSTILTPGSEIIASKYPESQKGGGFMTLSKEKNFIERLVQYKCVLPYIVVQVRGPR